VKRIAKIILLIASALAFCGAIIIGITQTEAFRNWLKDYALGLAAKNLNAKVSIGAIHGNLITGVRIENVSVTLDGQSVFSCTDVLVRYNPARIPSQFLSLAEVDVHNPVVHVWKGIHDTVWNIERLAKPTGTPPGEFTWTIEAEDIELQNGTISVCDSSAAPTTAELLSPLNQTTNNIFASLGCRISKNVQDVTINHLSLNEPVTGFHLRDLAGDLYHANDSSRVRLSRVQTDHSDFAIDLGAGKPATLTPKDSTKETMKDVVGRIPFTIKIRADKFSLREARIFTPALAPFDSTITLQLDAHGTPENLTLQKCELGLDRSALSLVGTLHHLTTPEEMGGEIKISRSLIVSSEAIARMPGENVEQFRFLGDVKIGDANIKGDTKDVKLVASVETAIGSANIDGSVMRKDSLPQIKARVVFGKVNLNPINPASLPVSNIAGQVQISGTGATLSDFSGSALADLLPTQIGGRSFDNASLRCRLNHGQIAIDTLHGTLASGNGAFDIHGSLDTKAVPRYQLAISTSSLNVAALTLDQKITRLNAGIDINGESFNPDSLMFHSLSIHTAECEIYGRTVPSFSAALNMTEEDDKSISTNLTSDIGTGTIKGRYSLFGLIDKLNAIGNTVAEAVTDSIAPAFNSFRPQPSNLLVSSGKPWLFQDTRPIDASFKFTLTNPLLLSAFLESDIQTHAQISGTLASDSNEVKTTLDGTFGGFVVDGDSSQFELGKTLIHVNVAQYLSSPISMPVATTRAKQQESEVVQLPVQYHVGQNIAVTVQSDSLNINGTMLTAPAAAVRYDRGKTTYDASVMMGDSIPVNMSLKGTGVFSDVATGDSLRRQLAASIDSVRFMYGKNVRWNSISPMNVDFAGGQIDFLNAAMRSDAAKLTWHGIYDAPAFRDFDVTLNDFPLQSVQNYADSAVLAGLRGTIRKLHLVVNGTTDAPLINADNIEGDRIVFKKTDFGALSGAFRYADRNVTGEVHLATQKNDSTNAIDTLHRMDVDVSRMPIDLAMHEVGKRIPDGVPIDVRANLSSFSISFLELIVGETVDQLRGFATGPLNIRGTTPDIRYAGDMDIKDIRFRSIPTNMYFTADAKIRLGNDTLQIIHSHVSNIQTDLRNDSAIVYGNLFFKGFDFDGFDLWMTTDRFLVLTDASRTVSSSVYGSLILSTRSPAEQSLGGSFADQEEPLHFFGTINAPRLEGKLYIGQSDLTFPETSQQSQGGGYDVVYDLSAANRSPSKTPSHGIGVHNGTVEKNKSEIKDTSLPTAPEMVFSGGLLDRMRYKLQIVANGALHVSMDFGPTEKLDNVGLSGNLLFTRDGEGRANLTGPLYINGGTYSFFDQFQIDAGSNMLFIDSIENPQLSIIARTPPRIHYITETQATEYVQVEVIITGTRIHPQMTLNLMRGPNSGALVEQAPTSDNQSRAVLFLATHQFPEDFNATGGSGNLGSTLVATTASQILNSTARQLGISGTLNLETDQSNVVVSKVNYSTQFGNALVSAGTHFAQPSNLDATVAFSMGDILGITWLQQTRIETQVTHSDIGNPETGVMGNSQGYVYTIRVGAMDFLSGIGNGAGAFWKWVSGDTTKDSSHQLKHIQPDQLPPAKELPAPPPQKQSSTQDSSSEAIVNIKK